MYDENQIVLTPSPNIPVNINRASLYRSGKFNGYLAGEEHPTLDKPVPDAYQRKIRHAYFAAISYVDAQVGKVLDELKRLGLSDSTVIVVWGDHGWQLGDHRVWGKHTIFERALNSVLIMKIPDKEASEKRIDKIVSSVDIYPTLMELCGVEMPMKTDGHSLVPLLKNNHPENWNEAAWGYFNKGITMRTSRYRLTKYFRKEQPVIELYDHQVDPWENINVAGQHPDVVQKLIPLLEEGDTGLYGK